MPAATRNRIISQIELLGVSGDSHLHEGASRGHLWHEAEAQKNFQKTPPERFRAKENGIISPKGNPHGEPKTEPRRVCRRLIDVSYAATGSVSRAA